MLRKMAEIDVKQGLKSVLQRVELACSKRTPELQGVQPRLVAVSKTKPVEYIIQAYEEGKNQY